MRLDTLKFKDMESGWELSQAEFFPDLTLLVGVSGVGKTMVLAAIGLLQSIAQGTSSRSRQWEATFTGPDDRRYRWTGTFQRTGRIVHEELHLDGAPLVERNEERILLRGQQTPKLSPHESVLSLLNQEEGVAEAFASWERILGHEDDEHLYRGVDPGEFVQNRRELRTLAALRASNVSTREKLGLLPEVAPEVLARIAIRFKDIFPTVEEVTVKVIRQGNDGEIPVVKLKEFGCERWFEDYAISAGMLRTLYHLARMELWPDGTLVLIDEFENSLGVNCLAVVTRELLSASRRLQFIITSHHPYIINNISPQHWKILTRKGPVVTAHNAADLGIGRSNHQAFIQLLNAERFRDGVEVP